MAVVAGVDFGTLSVRVTLVDSECGPVGTASASYPLHRRREDPDFATQSHADQMAALEKSEGLSEKDALKRIARERGVSKSELWRELQRERALCHVSKSGRQGASGGQAR